ncbi:Aminodeoxychorismate/anthranilate synthase component 2 [Planctomycetes bacterium Pan216]|uniref:Aminodeoxychorismate/anthranilate synthase component 2 n=1 Tax=Kolteria novifilia TaxID=2527975 RepID=A0A518B7F3_9BACT|nr:Aminodeoxychorismate/anthranilate synthase component 2 [Planctomycetes bacterium Pan216]
MILLIDNYDSFTYNLVQRLGEIDASLDMRVIRNDEATVDELSSLRPSKIIISPGPCTPNEAGISKDVIKWFAGQVPVLGVCLGHQCMGAVYGADVVRADRIMHGKTSMIHHDGKGVYDGLPNPFEATRYHSLIVRRETVPEGFVVSAWTDEDEIMGLRHESLALEGVQFHPESFLTSAGHDLLRNFVKHPC